MANFHSNLADPQGYSIPPGTYGSNWPLRGAKWTLWEGGIKANGLIWSPLLNQSAYTYNGLMHVTDWLPTLFSAAGGDPRTLPQSLYGIDLWHDLMSGKRDNYSRKEVLHNIDDTQQVFSLRVGDYKLNFGTVFGGTSDGWYLPPGEKLALHCNDEDSRVGRLLRATEKGFNQNPDLPIIVKCGEMKSPCTITADKICLFNIKDDPCEYNNLAKQMPEMVNQLMKMVESINKTAVPPGNVPADPQSNPALHGYYWGPWIE